MTEEYKLKYDDEYTIVFQWWDTSNIGDGDTTIYNQIPKTLFLYLYDNNGEIIIEDRNIVLLYSSIEYRNDLSNIKINRDVLHNNYFIFSLFAYNFIKKCVKAVGFKDLKSRLQYYDREHKLKELLK